MTLHLTVPSLVSSTLINETKDVMTYEVKASEIDISKVGYCPNYLCSINFMH